mmetsp:Transcript_23094/g.44140  ORF Transcript_23094/g.44140 Transcript_23094/m.44140 type:complete len:426 (+) Transcript_23094:387-1664(+)
MSTGLARDVRFNLDTSVPTGVLLGIQERPRLHNNRLLRAELPLDPIKKRDRSLEKELLAKEYLLGEGYGGGATTSVKAYPHPLTRGAGDSAHPTKNVGTEPVAGTMASWPRYMPRDTNNMLAAGAKPQSGNMPYAADKAWQGAVPPSVKGKLASQWVVVPSQMGLKVNRDHSGNRSIIKLQRLVRDAAVVTEHVSDATLKQIEYFMYAVPPPLTSGEVHRRLLIAGEPASRTRTPASDVTQLSRINSRGTDPGGGLGLSRGTDRARLEGLGASARLASPPSPPERLEPRAASGLRQNTADTQVTAVSDAAATGATSSRPASSRQKSLSPARREFRQIRQNEFRMALVDAPPRQPRPPTLHVVPKDTQQLGGGFMKGRSSMASGPKWSEHSLLLAQAQAEAAAAREARAAQALIPQRGMGSRAPRF